jgi:hypothetical protein
MPIYLRHPVHGTKVATMAMEAEFDEQNGWVRYDVNTPSAPEVTEDAAPANELEVKRRRGRPPAQPAEE